ncbi:hypothetical protein WA026_015024 [Henosepilachna vigintioctopunctata]|uniref:Homeobox domain-containing protein n=1 Tax=Henosepilachna vigintioctopunctata TaxID=420089 RepID=A0AAW1U803_9CUCU
MSENNDYYDDESNPTSPASSTQSGNPRLPNACPNATGKYSNKRYRTQMSSTQVRIMKSLFNDYNTPTMAECEMLGREIGLPKRVIQVWFQNARAKEKKGKVAMQKVLGSESDPNAPIPEDCKFCNFKYSHKYSVQDHIFTKGHIANVRLYLESMSKDNETNDFIAPPPLPGVSGSISADSTTHPQQQQQQQLQQAMNNNSHLQLLQMAGMQVSHTGCKEEPEENQETLFQQLYAMGNNANFGAQNQYMHHAMFGTNELPMAQLGKL